MNALPDTVTHGRKVSVKCGKLPAGASLFFKCPGGKRLKTFGTIGYGGFSADRDYVDHRQTYISSFSGRDSTATYAVCR